MSHCNWLINRQDSSVGTDFPRPSCPTAQPFLEIVLLSITTPPNICGLQHSALFLSNASQSCFCRRKFLKSETSASSQQGFNFVFVCGSCKFFSGRQNKGETKAKRLQTTGCKALSWAKGSSALIHGSGANFPKQGDYKATAVRPLLDKIQNP